ncbi:hypothetical protein TPHA_0D01240 [Tetrapisispora phaffii CBS 4417]|uniref:Serine/threonine-protein phosphatase 2A activator n=1 Tax=Tetrapisispora phaffii (strain ATCC 24235 / CBS 4417 / NBRC 1672 / NRRL Y-8282 / UCD 70-5) TaxID=1071381 RepID=G8BSE4_TETPH|nr:hypothetical protein TPHA_0D01240 [Tetrapisispora phaffii CBS 4417]CCE62765.1 hypothetical protein TPHA_0D01240 [Tetrapisispora phaffii CBS 4417]
MLPQKRLLTNADMEIWDRSQTQADLLNFLKQLAKSVEGKENTDYTLPISQPVESMMKLLHKVQSILFKHPVVKDAHSSRFGKVEFRDFYDDLTSQSKTLLKECFPSLTDSQIEQLYVYVDESWGNKQRIDYGSGHELNFMCFIYGLTSFKIFDLERDATNLVLKVFIQYLKLMRVLELQYWLEPAGSHGVWGLDDYHFLPFLFGAYQLSTHKHLKPSSIHNDDLIEMFADKYLYFGCIEFINSVKTTTTLRWHSPMLDDISGVKKWSKVAEGMFKMYEAEVIKKLPIMQHFYFNDMFLICPENVSPPREHIHDGGEEDECLAEGHAHSTYGDCCGIKVPSAIAASQINAMNKNKPLPFD